MIGEKNNPEYLIDAPPGALRTGVLSTSSTRMNFLFPGKFCNRPLTEILTEIQISHSLIEFNQPFKGVIFRFEIGKLADL